jgi:uncharacterized membrane protein
MWLDHNLAWWGVALAAAGLALMFPVAIFANIATPRLQAWWASRSKSSALRRLLKLKEELEDLEQHYELISEKDALLLRGLYVAATLILMCMLVIPTVGYIVVLPPFGSKHLSHTVLFKLGNLILWMLLAIGLDFLLSRKYLKRLKDFGFKHSPVRREDLKSEIAKLTAKVD